MNFGFEIIVGRGASGKIEFYTSDTSVVSIDSFEYVKKPTGQILQ